MNVDLIETRTHSNKLRNVDLTKILSGTVKLCNLDSTGDNQTISANSMMGGSADCEDPMTAAFDDSLLGLSSCAFHVVHRGPELQVVQNATTNKHFQSKAALQFAVILSLQIS
jgi:hypothetical protein